MTKSNALTPSIMTPSIITGVWFDRHKPDLFVSEDPYELNLLERANNVIVVEFWGVVFDLTLGFAFDCKETTCDCGKPKTDEWYTFKYIDLENIPIGHYKFAWGPTPTKTLKIIKWMWKGKKARKMHVKAKKLLEQYANQLNADAIYKEKRVPFRMPW